MKRYDFRYTTKPWKVVFTVVIIFLLGIGMIFGAIRYSSSIIDLSTAMVGDAFGEGITKLGVSILTFVLTGGIAFGVMNLLYLLLFRLFFLRATAELDEDVVVIHTKQEVHTLHFADINEITFSNGETKRQYGDGKKSPAIFFEIHHNSGRKLLFGSTTLSGNAKIDAAYFAFREDLIKEYFDFVSNSKSG